MGSFYASRKKRRRASGGLRLDDGSRIVVVGNGMVGHRFCRELVGLELTEKFSVTVVGEEDVAAYDRIQLSGYVDHQDPDRLLLDPESWYEENSITLQLGKAVESIDRDGQEVILEGGETLPFDLLILATGSRPAVPPIEGIQLPEVYLYRTLADIAKITDAATGKKSAFIIGGGLLGLEAAQAVQKLGLQVSVVERARFLMPQQLNETAAGYLEKEITKQGIRVFTGQGETRIEEADNGLTLQLTGRGEYQADLVIVSAGITPNSELAETADLKVGARGGVVVNDQLETEDERIFAIGECALFGGRIYGLAAPGFAMARHVAKRIAGEKTMSFPTPDTSTRLKMLGVDVVTVGDALEDGEIIEFESDEVYRMLVLGPRGRLRGALGVGKWEESGKIQTFFQEEARLKNAEKRYFEKEGVLSFGSGETPVAQLPESRIICNCLGVSKGTLMTCLEKGDPDPGRLAEETGASTICGSCDPLLQQLCGINVPRKRPVASRGLLAASGLALLAVIVTFLAPPVEMAKSVESWWFKVDVFWRDRVTKQITGFSLAGLFFAGVLFSLRKRLPWFRIGHFARWRFFHAAFGLTALIVLFFHTGFRFGHNLNFWLMLTFVLLNLLGAGAGIIAAVESFGTSSAALRARQLRPFFTWAHIVLFWPLPVLLLFHILSVYLY